MHERDRQQMRDSPRRIASYIFQKCGVFLPFDPLIRWTGKELGANPVRVFMSGDLGGKQSHAFPLKTIQMH